MQSSHPAFQIQSPSLPPASTSRDFCHGKVTRSIQYGPDIHTVFASVCYKFLGSTTTLTAADKSSGIVVPLNAKAIVKFCENHNAIHALEWPTKSRSPVSGNHDRRDVDQTRIVRLSTIGASSSRLFSGELSDVTTPSHSIVHCSIWNSNSGRILADMRADSDRQKPRAVGIITEIPFMGYEKQEKAGRFSFSPELSSPTTGEFRGNSSLAACDPTTGITKQSGTTTSSDCGPVKGRDPSAEDASSNGTSVEMSPQTGPLSESPGTPRPFTQEAAHYAWEQTVCEQAVEPGRHHRGGDGPSWENNERTRDLASQALRVSDSTQRAGRRKLEGNCEDDEPSDHEGSPHKRARLGPGMPPVTRELACPFYKRNNYRYFRQRVCRTSGWPTVHRVKEHLYRHHMHYVCDRCSRTFKSSDQLRSHLRETSPCQVAALAVPEDVGFGQDVEKKLRSRKKIEGQTEWDKWVHMFRILFPSFRDKATPSPYVEFNVSPDFDFSCEPFEVNEELPPETPPELPGSARLSNDRAHDCPEQAAVHTVPREQQLSIQSSIRKMVEEEVRSVLSSLSPPKETRAREDAAMPEHNPTCRGSLPTGSYVEPPRPNSSGGPVTKCES